VEQHPELPYWLALRRAGLGSTNFALLLARFGTIELAWRAAEPQLGAAGLDAQYVRAVNKARASFDADRELRLLEEHRARAVTWLDESYPLNLRDIPQSPPVIFVRGNHGPQFEQAVAVVGTRHVTPYGRQAAEHFCTVLARSGVAIISGLARGVDAIAHRVALENGTPTVAVLAGGIDQVYPRENAGLAERIVEQGCLVSEYPVGIPARRDYFPRRNRILSGLAKAALLVEAGEGSGALHTANWAFEQGRDVFAIPGSIFSRQSQGTNQLIRENTAKLVMTPEQLCQELNLIATGPVTTTTPPDATAQRALFERARTLEAPGAAAVEPKAKVKAKAVSGPEDDHPLLKWLASGPLHIDEIARSAGRPIAEVSASLQILELEGRVQQSGPMTFSRA
jgi:DNA processing protein